MLRGPYPGCTLGSVLGSAPDRFLPSRTIGDRMGEAKASGNLGNTLKVLGRFDEAVVCCQRHLDVAQEQGDKVGRQRWPGSPAGAGAPDDTTDGPGCATPGGRRGTAPSEMRVLLAHAAAVRRSPGPHLPWPLPSHDLPAESTDGPVTPGPGGPGCGGGSGRKPGQRGAVGALMALPSVLLVTLWGQRPCPCVDDVTAAERAPPPRGGPATLGGGRSGALTRGVRGATWEGWHWTRP